MVGTNLHELSIESERVNQSEPKKATLVAKERCFAARHAATHTIAPIAVTYTITGATRAG